MGLSQTFIELMKYKLAMDELFKAKRIAKTMKFSLFITMINRRLAIIHAIMGDMEKACKTVDKCQPWQGDSTIPMLELGMTYFTKYYIHRKANTSKDTAGIKMLSCKFLILN